MAKARYAKAFVQNTPIMLGDPAAQYGVLLSEYDVEEYWDLRTSSQSIAPMRAYTVTLKQRITVGNFNAAGFAGSLPPGGYQGYPILVVQKVSPGSSATGLEFYLEDYSPKTLNAAVNTSQNQARSSSDSSSVQHTTGSSTAVTNSYEVSDSVGFFGADATGSVSASVGKSTTTTEEQSNTSGRGAEHGSQSGLANSMSIKDWASFAYLDVQKQQPAWVWGQEYPWNVIDYRTSQDGKTIDLPKYVQALLYDGAFLYPPSHIAQFGLNFVAHARWTVYVQGAAGSEDEQISFAHTLTYWEASHSGSGAGDHAVVTATLAPITVNHTIETVVLNLPVLSLEAIAAAGSGNGAVIGFGQAEFITLPGSAPTTFRLKSGGNNLYVTQGAGFSAPTSDDSIMTAANVSAVAPATLTLQFKVIDPGLELSLHFRHWKTTTANCLMTLLVNGQTIMRHVDAMEAGSGTDNLTTVTLRAQDYTSSEFYDYLVMGINTVSVTITPADGSATCGYALRALAIQ